MMLPSPVTAKATAGPPASSGGRNSVQNPGGYHAAARLPTNVPDNDLAIRADRIRLSDIAVAAEQSRSACNRPEDGAVRKRGEPANPDDVAKGVDAAGECATRVGHRSGQRTDDPRAVLQRPLDRIEKTRAIETAADDHRAGVVDPLGFGVTVSVDGRQFYVGGERSRAFRGLLDAGGAADILGSETQERQGREIPDSRCNCDSVHMTILLEVKSVILPEHCGS